MVFLPANSEPSQNYINGTEMWLGSVSTHGIDEAIKICRNYLYENLLRELSEDERQFCLGLFTSIYEAAASIANPTKLVYPYDFKTADDRTEGSYYNLSRRMNVNCAEGIDNLINNSCYKANFYNLEIAAMIAILDYGFPRNCQVVSFNILSKVSDGRLSLANLQWASTFKVQEKAFDDAWLKSHAVLLNGFCKHIRELYQRLRADQYVLPGNKEQGEFNENVEIKQSVITSDDGNGFLTGYTIGHNPAAVSPWVCWQFAVRDGVRHYNWGIYSQDEQTVIDAYIARVFVALN